MKKVLPILVLLFALTISELKGQIADFRASAYEGCAPLEIGIEDQSQGGIVKWLWTFGNGNQSALQDPGVIYTNPGTFTVHLTVWDAQGFKDTISKVIRVFKIPTAEFNHGSPTLICTNQEVAFADLSIPGDGAIVKRRWDFANGYSSSSKDPNHAFSTPGVFKIALLVEDANGCIDFEVKERYVEVKESPAIEFSSIDKTACALPHQVNVTSVVAGGLAPYTYKWDLGNKQSVSNNPAILFSTYGQRDAELAVTDALGCVTRLTKKNFIQIQKLSANFMRIGSQVQCGTDNSYQFVSTSTPNLDGLQYTWDLGDGTKAYSENPEHTYAFNDTFNVKLRVAKGACSSDIELPAMAIVKGKPLTKFDLSDTVFCENGIGTFSARNTSHLSYVWDIGGHGYGGTNGTFNIQKPGIFPTKLTVLGEGGCKSVFNGPRVIYDVPQIRVNNFMNLEYCTPALKFFTDRSFGKIGLSKFEWIWSDGKSDSANNAPQRLQTERVLKDTGLYSIFYKVTNAFGCTNDTTLYTKVGMKVSPTNFVVNPKIICPSEPVFIKDVSPKTPITPLVKTWILAQEDEVGGSDPSTTSFPGWHPATLIYNHRGCEDSLTMDSMVYVKPIGAIITFLETRGCQDTRPITPVVQTSFVSSYRVVYPDGSETLDTVKSFVPKEGPNWVHIYAVNDTMGCALEGKDSLKVPYTLHPKTEFTLQGNCLPVHLNIKGTEVLDFAVFKIRYYVNNQLIHETNKPEFGVINFRHSYTFGQPGTFTIRQVFYNEEGCPFEDKDTTITLKGVAYKPGVTQHTFCSPIQLTLSDSAFVSSTDAKRYWLSAKDTIWQGSKNMQVQLEALSEDKGKYYIEYVIENSSVCIVKKRYYLRHNGSLPLIKITRFEDCHYPFFKTELLNLVPQSSIYFYYDGKVEGANSDYAVAKFTSPGWHQIRVKYTDPFGCKFNVPRDIWVDTPKTMTKIVSDKTVGTCPPLKVKFNNVSEKIPGSINQYFWEFGDGSTSDLEHPLKTYFVPGEYAVKLTVTDQLGCSNSVSIPNMIEVKGPKGTFSFPRTRECAPVQVPFELLKTDASYLKWDMGDGELIPDQRTPTHNYAMPGMYIPVAILGDSSGCRYALPSIDTIFAYPKPTVQINSKYACFNQPLALEHQSNAKMPGALKYAWFYQNDTLSKDSSPIFTSTVRGENEIQLIISNQGGCIDSSIKKLTTPNLKVRMDKSRYQACLGEKVKLSSIVEHDNPIDSMIWFLDEQLFEGSQISYQSNKTGTYSVLLLAKDILGCKDTVVYKSGVVIGDTVTPANLHFYYASVNNNETVEIKYEQAKNTDFWTYSIFNPKTGGLWGEVESRMDTLITKEGLNTLHNSYCFKLGNTNGCLKLSDTNSIKKHCTIDIKGVAEENRSNVHWNKYIGWDVEKYEVYRKELVLGSDFKFLATVVGTQTSFIDTNINCKMKYAYKVKAYERDGFSQFSWSDTYHVQPVWTRIPKSNKNWRVTVEDNEFTRLEWESVKNPDVPIHFYSVYRKKGNAAALNLLQDTISLTYLEDFKTKVNQLNYTYYVVATDTCGMSSVPTKPSKTILLEASLDKIYHRPVLHWNKYTHWDEGVKNYILERKNEQGDFEQIATLTSTDTQYLDMDVALNCNPFFEYRVKGIRNQRPDTTYYVESVSNYAVVQPNSTLFVPNAFTPNNDGLNDVFGPKGSHILDYKLQIFNRWGEKLYETQECMKAWNAMYAGSICQEGVYLYLINAKGVDGKLHNLEGNFTLLK